MKPVCVVSLLVESVSRAVVRAGLVAARREGTEVVQQDLVIEDGKVTAYRSKLKVSFKYEDGKD